MEDPGGLNYTTGYGYDALLSVAQGGQTRSFSYDSLRRLTQATNPESGMVCYGNLSGSVCQGNYDGNGNLLSRTDARGITTSYAYDLLNRVTMKSYSDGTTPPVTYSYDVGVANGIGHLTRVANANSMTNYSEYDELGRVKQSNQQTAGQTYGFVYGYNRADALTSERYPSGRVVTSGYDGANRPKTLSGTLAGQGTNYVTSASYWITGESGIHANMMTFGNNLVSADWYDNRLQPFALLRRADNTENSYLQGLQFGWNLNGTLASVSEGNGAGAPYNSMQWVSQSYSYDGVNRLQHGEDTGGCDLLPEIRTKWNMISYERKNGERERQRASMVPH